MDEDEIIKTNRFLQKIVKEAELVPEPEYRSEELL